MTDTDPGEDAPLFPKTAGERLREAREAQGLSLAEIAARTRVPVRQLEAIEQSNFALLPSVTYSVGFAKAYARAVGADEVAIARDVRAQNDQGVRRTEYEAYEIDEPSRVPSGGLALAGLVVAVLLLVAAGLWYGTNIFRGDDAQQTATPAAETEIGVGESVPPPAAVPQPVTGGQVSLTATDEVWLRIYDATGKSLYEATLKPGERYEVPADANGPMINVGRPDKLQVMLNGSLLPPLGDGRLAIKDVGVSAAALTARAGSTPPTGAVPNAGGVAPAYVPGAAVPSAFAPSARPTSRSASQRTSRARPTSSQPAPARAVERPDAPPTEKPAPSAPTPAPTPAP